MAKRPSKHLRPPRPLSRSAYARSDDKSDGRWMVQAMAADQTQKSYSCPGCGLSIPPATPHVVTWPSQPRTFAPAGVDERRHWHTACWNRKR